MIDYILYPGVYFIMTDKTNDSIKMFVLSSNNPKVITNTGLSQLFFFLKTTCLKKKHIRSLTKQLPSIVKQIAPDKNSNYQ